MSRRNYVVPILIFLNVGVFLMWSFVDRGFMQDHFTVSWAGLISGQFETLILAEFSHNWLVHLLINMFVLNSFGGLLENVLGGFRFLKFYLFAAIVASISHAAVSSFVLGAPELPAVGASGAIAGCVLLFSLMFPREKILLFGIVPLPALIGALAFIGLDLWGLIAQAEGGGLPIGHGAHLGGAFTGIIYYFMFVRRRWRRVSRFYE